MDPPAARGVCPRQEFLFYASTAFVTYTRSRVKEKEEFHDLLQASLQRSLSRDRVTEKVTVRVFGSKELHEDGVPHYHVLVRFSKPVYWKKARERFSVWILAGGRPEVDTHSIFIRKKRADEEEGKFLYCVQTYIAKHGDVFGEWVSV